MAVFNRTPEHIQIAPDPNAGEMKLNAGHRDWCLSHLPGNGCFISHHCAHQGSKNALIRLYQVPDRDREKHEEEMNSGTSKHLNQHTDLIHNTSNFWFKIDYLR